jgi:hypothetical protein
VLILNDRSNDRAGRAQQGPLSDPRRGLHRCRVEHRDRGTTTLLARGVQALPYRHELAPFVSRLRRNGASGVVVLVEEATGLELGRHAVRAGAARR